MVQSVAIENGSPLAATPLRGGRNFVLGGAASTMPPSAVISTSSLSQWTLAK
jgi:hypothetical protein